MEESNVETFGAATRLLVDKAHTLFFALIQCGVGVLDSESDVVHTTLATVLLYERCYGALRAGWFEELDFHVADFEKGCFYFLVSNFLNGVAFEAH